MARIAIAVRNLPGGTGASRIVLLHARALVERGHAVDVYCRTAKAPLVSETGARLFTVRHWLDKSREHFARRFAQKAEKGGYDFAFGHGDVLRQDALYLHNLSARYQEAVMERPGPPEKDYAVMHDRVLRGGGFDVLFANSALMKRDLVERYGVPERKVAVLYPGCDTAAFSPEAAAPLRSAMREELGVGEGEVAVGLVTSGDLKKRGADFFVETLARLPEEARRKARFVLVAKPSNAKPYEEQARQAGVVDRLVAVPPIAEPLRYYAALDAFFLPARLEEYGLVVGEAMACGLPVVTTRQVGAAEWLGEESAGLLTERPDAEAHARQVAMLIESAEKRASLGKANRARILPNDEARHMESLLAALREAGRPLD